MILENVNKNLSEAYLHVIRNDYGLSNGDILELTKPLTYLGSPFLYRIGGLADPVSLTSLRYLKVALDIVSTRGSKWVMS